MARGLICVVAAIMCVASRAAEPKVGTVVEQVERRLVKEPKYQGTPKYSLLLLGTEGKVQVWLVEDGKRLFVDKNANGDLTDDGPPLEPSDVRSLGKGSSDFNYVLKAIVPADGSRHTQFDLRRWNYGEPEDSYGLSVSLDDRVPMYAGWFGTLWSAKAATAPAIHFGGPLTPRLLRSKEFVLGPGKRRLSLAFVNPGAGEGAMSRLSIDAIEPQIVPKVHIEWPAAGGRSLKSTHALNERCCYWEFYTTAFESPEGAEPGMAKARVEFPAGAFPFELTTSVFDVPVVLTAQKGEE